MINYGYQNEKDFVLLFNDQCYLDLDKNSRAFINDLFEEEIDSNVKLIAWKNKMNQKTDIFIKYKNHVKGISLKCGNSNSIHCEQVQEIRRYLEKIGIKENIINKYLSYHYGYKKDENGNNIFSELLSSEEYKKFYQRELDIFNKEINKTKIIVGMVDRFIIRGRNSDYDIDALICGTIDDYVWIKKYELYDLILSKRCLEYTSPHIACLTIGPKKRNLKRDSKNFKDRYLICVRWNFIRESIIDFKNNLKTRHDEV